MSRTERLLELLQILRQHRYPVTGPTLAAELGISLRSVYRDIATLQAQGARIDGAAGLGYLLKPGYMLPPLMFSPEEIEALVLGMRWVADKTDNKLAEAARAALGKIASVLPHELREQLHASALLIGPSEKNPTSNVDLTAIRQAIRKEHKLNISYKDLKENETQRIIWPLALGFFDRLRVIVAWCELRQGFRHFRTDRIISLYPTEEFFPLNRQALLQEWRDSEGIPLQ